jgi:hypothetical protein
MPTFIKTGFWEKTRKGYKEWLNLDELIESKIPTTTSTTTTLAPYQVYTALISQTGTNAPTVIVLENTIGNIVWTRTTTGNYSGTLVGAFPEDKTGFLIAKEDIYIVLFQRGDDDFVSISSVAPFAPFANADGRLTKAMIEIRVYN